MQDVAALEDQKLLDLRLIAAHQAGDADAFGELVERYRDRVYRLCFRLTLDKEDALDLCQITFFKAYRALAGYNNGGAFFTWLYRIATNAAIDLLRERQRRPRPLETAEIEERLSRAGRELARLAGSEEEPSPERVALRREFEGEIARALEQLSPELRATVLLRAAEGLSYREIAGVLRCPVGTVMSRLHAARERLRGLLKDYLSVEA